MAPKSAVDGSAGRPDYSEPEGPFTRDLQILNDVPNMNSQKRHYKFFVNVDFKFTFLTMGLKYVSPYGSVHCRIDRLW